jgi:putative transposase
MNPLAGALTMSNYRRWYQPGGTYFFTVITYGRRPLFRNELGRDLVGTVMREVQGEMPFKTEAIVLLHDHLHAIWTLPPGNDGFPDRWQEIKTRFTKNWLAAGGSEARVTRSQAARGHRGIWQKRFWEHLIRDEDDLSNHCDYIHYNPVKHGYVRWPREWPYSSFHRFVAAGHYTLEWGGAVPTGIAGMNYE